MSRDDSMPPGVSSFDIPGNTAKDAEWEKLIEFLAQTDLEPGEIAALVTAGAPLAQHLMRRHRCSALPWMEETVRLLRLLAIAWASSMVEQSDA